MLGHLAGTHAFRDLDRRAEAKQIDELLVLRVDAAFSFVNAEAFKDFILERSRANGRPIRAVVVDGSSINDLDTTGVEALESVLTALEEEGVALYLTGLIGPVRETMKRSGLRARFGREHFFRTPHRAVAHILGEWDEQDGGTRRAAYEEATQKDTTVPTPSEP
jgi:SulP family sulfate permease